ncbi:unnamed protein product [Tilletia controversa]|uniref:Uncharacterized protein n=1 Tax=Tilletia controversa TaxID=13291 RepID=A0A8X7SVC7_9BASI|nr:hypothetical protein CF328_g4893 [Tilletia controversa]KAE8245472.1 hypothetical protein A4X06_0g5673 [Tilletia controversa]CAD6899339.1 unnamed protein product [Tilletia controversa]CAD6939843.1 unnamed protein product [Tilletia controversa]CAD6949989.1 unnamed protein product [Tilletia controversa]
MSGHLSSLDLAVAWFNRFALRYAILGNTFTAILVVTMVLMTLFSSMRVFKTARYTIIILSTVAQISASVLNSIDARRLGLHENIPDTLFTAQVAMLFVVPLFADFALVPRIMELTRQKEKTLMQDRRTLFALALPLALKVPRVILVADFLSMSDTCVPLTKTSPLASVLMCTPAQKFALLQWTFSLVDQSITMLTLAICMYHMGWGWGDKRAVSKTIFGKASMFGCTLAATMVIPVIVLTALLALHSSGKKTHIEGYLIALQPNVSVLGVALAALYPLVRVNRRLQLARVRMQSSQTEARRLSMAEYEGADPFANLTSQKSHLSKTLLGAPHLRPGGIPHLKRHSSHSGYLNSTMYSHSSQFSPTSDEKLAQDTYTIMNVKMLKPGGREGSNGSTISNSESGNWTITRQRSPRSEGSDDGMDEKVDQQQQAQYQPQQYQHSLPGTAPSSPKPNQWAPSTPTRMGGGQQQQGHWGGSNNGGSVPGSPYSPSVRGTPLSQQFRSS